MRHLQSAKELAFQFVPIVGLAICAALGIWGWRTGVLTSQDAMAALVRRVGFWGPVLFILLQVVQVVIPILPGGVSCLMGVLLFGPLWGFIYNYVGVCAGSMLAFAAAKQCGRPLLQRMFRPALLEKYDRWTHPDGHFARWFALAIFLPVAPDDFLCYLAGTTAMRWQQFSAIIWSCKPCSVALYSLFLYLGWTQALHFFG